MAGGGDGVAGLARLVAGLERQLLQRLPAGRYNEYDHLRALGANSEDVRYYKDGAFRNYVAHDPRTERPAVDHFVPRTDLPHAIDAEATKALVAEGRPDLTVFGRSVIIHTEPVTEIVFPGARGVDCRHPARSGLCGSGLESRGRDPVPTALHADALLPVNAGGRGPGPAHR